MFISPNQLASNETSNVRCDDWNSDGDYGKPPTNSLNVEYWFHLQCIRLEIEHYFGSPPCQLTWNTVIDPDGIVVFSADSDIVMDYFDGETVSITDTAGTVVDTMNVPEKFAFWGNSIVEDSSGSLVEVDPTPGFGPNDPASTVALNIVKCYKVQEQSSDAYLLKGRVVTMESESSVLNQGNVLVRNGKIDAVWSSSSQIPVEADLTNVPVIETNGTIYGLLTCTSMHYNHIPLWDFDVHLNEQQRSDEGGYTNRYQWGNNWDYGQYHLMRPMYNPSTGIWLVNR